MHVASSTTKIVTVRVAIILGLFLASARAAARLLCTDQPFGRPRAKEAVCLPPGLGGQLGGSGSDHLNSALSQIGGGGYDHLNSRRALPDPLSARPSTLQNSRWSAVAARSYPPRAGAVGAGRSG